MARFILGALTFVFFPPQLRLARTHRVVCMSVVDSQ